MTPPRSLRSAPTARSIKSVLGLSTVPPTWNWSAYSPGSDVGTKFSRIPRNNWLRIFSLIASTESSASLPRNETEPVAVRRRLGERKSNSSTSSGGKAQIRRTQEHLIDQDDVASEMILCFGLFEVELRQFLDLQQLSERSEHRELLHMAILQDDGAGTGQSIGIGSFAGRLQSPF